MFVIPTNTSATASELLPQINLPSVPIKTIRTRGQAAVDYHARLCDVTGIRQQIPTA